MDKKKMRVLFTGSSSFTGYYFLKEINKQKIKTFAIFSRNISSYKKNYQKEILKSELKYIKPRLNIKFGSPKYLKLIQNEKIDTICFHHFIVGNLDKEYKFRVNLKKNFKKFRRGNLLFIFKRQNNYSVYFFCLSENICKEFLYK